MLRRKILITAAVGLCAILSAGATFACEGKTVIFEDNFKDDSGGWDRDQALRFRNNSMTIQFPSDVTSFRNLNLLFLVRDADICVETAFPAATDNNPMAGIIFWAPDYKSFYLFSVAADGTAGIHRFAQNKFLTVHSQVMAEVKKGPGAVNLLRVTLKGNLVAMYVNGAKYRDQHAPQPAGDVMFGTYAQVDKWKEGQIFLFKHLKVTSID